MFLCPCPVYGRHIGVREKQEPLWSYDENRFGSIVLGEKPWTLVSFEAEG